MISISRVRQKVLLCTLMLMLMVCGVASATGTEEAPSSEPITTSLDSLLAEAIEQPELSRFANGYTVYRSNELTVVEVSRPFPGAGTADALYYILYPSAGPTPTVEGADQVIGVPIESAVSMSTTFLAHFEKIDAVELVTGVDSLGFVYSPRFLSRADQIEELGFGAGVDTERLLVLDPDVVIVNSFGGDFDAGPTVEAVGAPVVVSGDWLENDPLGRAEWFVFTSLFAGKSDEAVALMTEIADEYNLLVEIGRGRKERPTVLINAPFQGTWSIAGGASYAARLIDDAGGAYAYAADDSTGALFFDLEAVFAEAGDADIWINPGQWRSLDQGVAEDSRFAEFNAFAAGAVFNNNARVSAGGGVDYFESGAVNPHIVLADLLAIFHPDTLPEHELFYYQRLE